MKTIENKSDFKDWLLRFNPEDIVGISCDGSCCPLARYSKSDEVDAQIYWGVQTNNYEYVPEWAGKFIHKVDCYGGRISAEHALRILETCGD